MAALGGFVARRGLVQFADKLREARQLGRSFYEFYVPGDRITGFMSHWMTFSGEEMFALILLAAFLLFAPGAMRRVWLWVTCLVLMTVALALGMTRNAWLGTAVAACYLLWCWRRWLVLVAPIIVTVPLSTCVRT